MARTVVNVTASSTLDGRDISADGTKLDGIEANATADQTAAEIKSLVEASSDIALAGNPTTTTQSSGNNSTRIATTAFVADATSGLATDSNLNSKAPIASPTFTGVPAAPTASSGTNTTQLATTAFVTTAVAGVTIDGISSSATSTALSIASGGDVTIDGTDASTSIASPAILNLKAGDANNEYSTLRFATSADGSIAYIGAKATTTGAYPNSVGNLQFGVQNGSSTVTAMTIDNSGNVGIGTTSPTNYSDYVTLTLNDTQGGALDLEKGGTLTGELWTYRDTNDVALAATHSSGSIRIMTGGYNERMRIDSAGKVGIGTTAPGDYHSLSQFVVAQSGDAGITIASGTSNDGRIFFADGTSGSAESEGTIRYDHSNNSMFFSTSDTVRLRIDNDGVKFGTDSAATNALDDYEEGTWTPAYGVSTGGFTTLTHSTQTGYYTKVGNVCTAHGRLDTSAMSIGTASNYLFITGFPFFSKTGAYQSGAVSYSYGYTSLWPTNIAFQGSTNYIYLFGVDKTSHSATLGPSNLGTGTTYLYFSITYVTN